MAESTAVVKAESQQVEAQRPPLSLLEQSIEQGERYLKAFDRIRKIAITLTNTTDWLDQSGKPYLEAAGCAKIASAFGVQTQDVKCEKENVEDEKGSYVRYRVTGRGNWHTTQATEVGSASSRDDFFVKRSKWVDGVKQDITLPQTEVDLGDVEKKAFTNFMNRLIKRLIGLSFSWEDIEAISAGKISQATCAAVRYGAKGSKGGSTAAPTTGAAQSNRDLIWKQLLEMYDGETGPAESCLERITTFTGRDGNVVKGRRDITKLSDKGVPVVKQKVQALYDEWLKESANRLE